MTFVARAARSTPWSWRSERTLRCLKLQSALIPPDTILIGPSRLRAESEQFTRRARGDMTWFNVCLLMFVPQSLFDVLLRPAVENPRVTGIQFILDASEKDRWLTDIVPKLGACRGAEKVREPRWCELKESVSFILAEIEPEGAVEAHLSFWGEPFMARSTGRQIPRYIFHVQGHSELIGRLVEASHGIIGAGHHSAEWKEDAGWGSTTSSTGNRPHSVQMAHAHETSVHASRLGPVRLPIHFFAVATEIDRGANDDSFPVKPHRLVADIRRAMKVAATSCW